jgi:2-octaprenyl-6-methoxyphenol hydroxylase
MRQEYDVAIVGGGMVGNILARCFSRCGQRVILFDEEKSQAFGGIEVPISIRRVNQEFLAEIDMWHKTQSEIRRFHISASGHFGVVKIEEEEPLAYVTSAQQWLEYVKSQIEADQGVNVLRARVKSCDRLENVEVLETQDGQKFKAKRVVIADGANSPLANYLQVKVKRSGKAVRSVIFGVTAGNQLESSAWIRQKGGVIYGVIPKQGNQGWVVATMPLRSANSKSDAALIHDLGECLESHIGCIGVSTNCRAKIVFYSQEWFLSGLAL